MRSILKLWKILFKKHWLLLSENPQTLNELENDLAFSLIQIQDRQRAKKEISPRLKNWFEQAPAFNSMKLTHSIQKKDAPWLSLSVKTNSIPGMISDEEIQYYEYLGKFYQGIGEVVELGPWLGKSTHHIHSGLKLSPKFQDRKIHVYDDFVWRPDWMDSYVTKEERLNRHENFQFLFEKYVQDFMRDININRGRISDYDGNENLPLITWNGGKIELIYVDCGRTIEANQAWWNVFAPSFIPGKTLIIMQDWRLHREIPLKWYNQTKQFTDGKMGQLELVHEINSGGIGTFLYLGNNK